MTLKTKMYCKTTWLNLFTKAFFFTYFHKAERNFLFKFELNCLKPLSKSSSCEKGNLQAPCFPAQFGQRGKLPQRSCSTLCQFMVELGNEIILESTSLPLSSCRGAFPPQAWKYFFWVPDTFSLKLEANYIPCDTGNPGVVFKSVRKGLFCDSKPGGGRIGRSTQTQTQNTQTG
jgi:hypothetical protein